MSETSFFQDTKSEDHILCDTVGFRVKNSMRSAFKAMDDAVSEAEALISDGGEGRYGQQTVTADPEKLRRAFGDKAWAELQLFAGIFRDALNKCGMQKRARPMTAGVTVREAPPELLDALRKGIPTTGPAAMVQPTSTRMGNEAELVGADIVGTRKTARKQAKKPETT